MSMTDSRGVDITSRHTERAAAEFWGRLATDYVGEDPLRAKRLCVLALREIGEFPLDVIALAFGHHKGHVCRMIDQSIDELRETVLSEVTDPPEEER